MILFPLFFSIVIFAFIIRTIRNSLFILFLWQLKEYRLDRFLAYFQTKQGKMWLFNPLVILKWILFSLFITGIYIDFLFQKGLLLPSTLDLLMMTIGYYAQLAFVLTWIYETLKYFREYVVRGWKKPEYTVKIITTVFLFLIFLSIAIWKNIYFSVQFYIILDRTLLLILTLCLLISNIPFILIKKIIVKLAHKKICQNPNLLVIGITGSYGKTSTKEFLSTILSAKYKIIKTEGYNNTEIGVAMTVLKKLNKEHEIMITEMGAYKKGEIAAICKIVQPKIGIITGINSQHLQLFGSEENIVKAKFELIDNLVLGGKAFFNLNNKSVQTMFFWAKKMRKDLQIISCVISNKEIPRNSDLFSAEKIRVHKDKISFTVIHSNTHFDLEAPLAGKQNTENILLATSVAYHLGIPIHQIRKQVKEIDSPSNTMRIIKRKNNIIFINDTFNSNPDGILSILEYMKIFKGKKILVFTPLIELGTQSEHIHQKLGRKMQDICDLVLLTNSNYYQNITKHSSNSHHSKLTKFKIVDNNTGAILIKKLLIQDSVVCFTGKEAQKILIKLNH